VAGLRSPRAALVPMLSVGNTSAGADAREGRRAGSRISAQKRRGRQYGRVTDGLKFTWEVTDILLAAAPDITARQILQIRDRLAQAARRRGWAE
jgi:hypothetical protein